MTAPTGTDERAILEKIASNWSGCIWEDVDIGASILSDAAQLRRASLGAAQVPAGWKLVPAEPTEAMFTRFSQQIETGIVYVGGFLQAYRCMLDAAPEPTAGAAQVPSLSPDQRYEMTALMLDLIRTLRAVAPLHSAAVADKAMTYLQQNHLAGSPRQASATALSQPSQQGTK